VSVSEWVSAWVSQSVTQNELNALHIAIFHRSSPNLPPRYSPRRCGTVVTYCFWWKSEIFLSSKPEVELLLWKNIFNVKYLENGDREIRCWTQRRSDRKPPMGFRLGLWPLTLNPPSSRSLKLHVKYFENGDRYDDEVNGSRIGNTMGYRLAPWPSTMNDLEPS